MDYKDSLNLPRTDFAMKADLVAREPQRLEKWQAANLYGKIQEARAGAEKFVLHDGPPFANGDVHIGTALNKVLKDIIIKFQTIRGKNAPYIPGWDCHGLPIEFKVTQELRKAGDTASDAATIRTACEAYARKYIDLQRTQFKRLGVLGDWENPYLTFNKEYEADELRLFADIVEKGFVYRGKKPVYWSIPCRTALAEAEVEYQDHVSQSVYVKFPIVGNPGLSLIIWTTTPWTLPANLAVAYNSTFTYSMVQVNGEAFIVSTMLLSTVSEKCGWDGYEIIRTVYPEHLAQFEFQHPFCNRTGRLFAGDDFVDNSTGTGFVHIAPGHGLDDYNLGRKNGLPIYSPVDDNGCLAYTNDLPQEQQMPAEFIGKSILEKHGKSDANEVVLHELRVRNALLHQENYHHSYPHCWRSKTPIIFRAMDQWFIKIDLECGDLSPLCSTGDSSPAAARQVAPQESADKSAHSKTFRQRALEEIDHVAWIPDWGVNRIKSAVQSRPDWCISRQRTWGVPIPAFYDAQGNPILDAQIVRKTADLIEKHGSNVWFEKPVAELWPLVKPEGWTGPEATAKSGDTLDVWIDSGSSSRAVIARRSELRGKDKPFQCDMYLEGSDQHRGWFQSSLLLSLAGNGAAPFKTVLTHGFMVDEDRQKVSKSKQGTYEKPQTAERYIKDYGADVVRLWVASQDYRNDIIVSEERIKKVGEIYRVIRNALRYQLSNLYDFDPAKHSVPDEQLTGLDRWILGEFAKLEADVLRAYEAYEFHEVYQRVGQFAAVELSAIYHDVVKDRLYTDPANAPRRRSTQTALHRIVGGLCQMLSPLLAFTADEAWEFIPGKSADSVHLALWTESGLAVSEVENNIWKELFGFRKSVLPQLEKARKDKLIGKSLDAKLTWHVPNTLAHPPTGLSLTDEPSVVCETPTDHGYSKEYVQIKPSYLREPMLGELREIFGVSQLEISFEESQASPRMWFSVTKAAGQKCERCWHWEMEVGTVVAHPTLCGRCVEAVK